MSQTRRRQPEKIRRQNAIQDILLRESIATQADLTAALKAQGVDATQSTVSRDIKELKIVKVTIADGCQKYVSMSGDQGSSQERLIRVFTQAATEVRQAASLVVVRTLSGMAQAAASAIDAMQVPDVIGSIAGDDTVFLATASEEVAGSLVERLKPLIGRL
ncbi:MAG: arginine repressor [Bacillota bacterium]|nr:arginine repressor [Bacillota bacterium]